MTLDDLLPYLTPKVYLWLLGGAVGLIVAGKLFLFSMKMLAKLVTWFLILLIIAATGLFLWKTFFL